MRKSRPRHFAEKKSKHGKHAKRLKVNFKIFFFRILSLIIIICCVGYILRWLKETNHNQELLDELQSFVVIDDSSADDNISVDFDSLKQTNSDTVRLAYCK